MNSRSTEIYSRSTPTETSVRSTVCLHLSMVCLWFVYGSTVCLLFILDHCAPRIKLLIVAKYKLMSLPGAAYIRRSKKNRELTLNQNNSTTKQPISGWFHSCFEAILIHQCLWPINIVHTNYAKNDMCC